MDEVITQCQNLARYINNINADFNKLLLYAEINGLPEKQRTEYSQLHQKIYDLTMVVVDIKNFITAKEKLVNIEGSYIMRQTTSIQQSLMKKDKQLKNNMF